MIGLILIAIILVTAGGGYLFFKYTLRKALPQTSGEIALRGLRDSVEIIRDTYGVPHISAENEPDLYFAFGYAMAQDRLWQMEFQRRLGQGRLAEVFGAELVKVDRYFRTLTAAGLNKEVPEGMIPLIESFAAGINAYIETHRKRLPLEFKLLGFEPQRWGVDDYLDMVKVVIWSLSSGWKVDLTAAEMLEKVGVEKMRDAFPVWPEDAPLIIPQEAKDLSGLSNRTMEAIHLVERVSGLSPSAASNNWVVSGKRSVTGKPILANDTHLQLSNPSVWWEVHLVCPTINVSGFAFPGVPVVLIGHNRDVAWGFTNVMVDDVDFYIEKINPENPRQYWYKDHWENMTVAEEMIGVKEGEPVKTEILVTRHGPIVEEVSKGSEARAVSARWAFTEGLQPTRGIYLLAKARDIEGIKEALRYGELLGQNVVFADKAGNIGYWCSAMIPIRPKGDGMLPMPGWTGEYEWKGYVPFEERPHVINPEEGFIATANNKVTAEGYPYHISHYWEPMDRVTRIRQMLMAKEKLSIEDFQQMQQDVYSVSASEITPKLVQVLKNRLTSPEAQKAKVILSKWDFMMERDSAGACLFEVTYRKLMENIFKDELGEALFEEYIKAASFPPRALRVLFRKGSSPWFDDVTTAAKETMEDILAVSLEQMLSELKELLGNDLDEWGWGRIHSLTFAHVLGERKPLDRIFNLGPFPLGGSHLTVNMRQYLYEKPYHTVHGVSQRMIVDLSATEESLRVIPTGESGHLGSPHHKDQVALYLEGRYHPAWTDWGEVEKHSEAVLILKPAL